MNGQKRQITNEEALFYAEKIADSILSCWSEELGTNIGNLFRTKPEAVTFSLKLFGVDADPNYLANLNEFATAVEQRDRARLVSWFMQYAPNSPKDITEKVAAQIPFIPRLAREQFAQGLKAIKLKSGPASKLGPHEYPALAELASQLTPLILKLLVERDSRTKHTIQQMIEYQMNDFPLESAFLLKHSDRLETILKDKVLLKRAKKLPTRARLIADAMAGAEYNFEPRTSVERTRQGRRMARKKLV
jgi:hypothetical protein